MESVDNAAAQTAINDYVAYQQSQLEDEAAKAPTLVSSIIRFAIIMLAAAIIISVVVLIILIRSFKGSIPKVKQSQKPWPKETSLSKFRQATTKLGCLSPI